MRRYVFRLALLSLAALSPSVSYGDDQQIAQQILEKLQAEKKAGTLKGFSIDLQVDEGTVWLSGRVTSDQQQARALDLARRVAGVKQVVNDLTVSGPAKTGVAAKAVASPKIETPAPVPAPVPTYTYNPAPAQPAAAAPAIPFTPIESSRSIPATPIEPAAEYNTVAVEMPPAPAAPATIEATPLAAEPKAYQAEEYVPASTPAPIPQAAQRPSQPERRPAQQSVLNNVSKSLMGAVHGSKSEAVQHASTSHEIAKATGSGPIGSGVEPGTLGTHRGVVQAAQPVANVATAESMQPVYPAGPQMAGMVPMGMPYPYMVPVYAAPRPQVPLAVAPASSQSYVQGGGGAMGPPQPMYMPGSGVGVAPARYDHPQMPGYAWPSYAASPNYAAVTYPKQYSPTAWPYIGPFYPYPQVPLGWRKVTMEWDDGWWFLDFKDRRTMYNH